MECLKQDSSKVKKKIARCLGILEKDYPDICPSKDPTKHIFIGNAGLITKADEASLTGLINAVGSGLEALTLVPGKSYSFATFFKAEEAEIILSGANGRKSVEGSTSPVYMAFVDKVPSVLSAVKYEFPPGLHVLEEFISPDEEALLLSLIDWNENPADKAEGSVLKHRQVRHFGYEFKYSSNSVDKDHPLPQKIPEVLLPIVNRIVEKGIMPETPDQLTVNRYLPGHGIPPHVDTHCSFTDELLSLSTGGGITMDFRHVVGEDTPDSVQNPRHCAVYLKPRSLCVMTGPARYEWTHGICPRMTDVVPAQVSGIGLQLCSRQERVSFTFRKIREGECQCKNALVCDSQELSQKGKLHNEKTSKRSYVSEVNGDSAVKLERDHVLDVYDQIADHFSDTRHKPWPHVLEFVSSLSPGSFLLDVGCGNGKYLGHNKSIYEAGCDTSFELTKICKNRGFEVLNCNCLHLPYRSSLFDAVICIAVIHHLASEERRSAAIREMVRVLNEGGRGLIYVWALEQKRGKRKSAYLKQNKANRKDDSEFAEGGSGVKVENKDVPKPNHLPVHTNRTEFSTQDMLVPWKLKPQKKHNRERTASEGLSELQTNHEFQSNCKTSDKCYEDKASEQVPVFHRFYHVFKQSELEILCGGIDGVNLIESYYDEGNWCIIFEKKSQ